MDAFGNKMTDFSLYVGQQLSTTIALEILFGFSPIVLFQWQIHGYPNIVWIL